MENILNYALQINVLLSVVYLGYTLLLKNLTFYKLNRVYFLSGILFSFIYPFLAIRSWFSRPIPSVGEIAMEWSINFSQEVEKSIFTLNNLLIVILILGVMLLSARFAIQMTSLLRIHMYSEPAEWQSYLFRNVFIPIVPFSFLNKIYVNRDHHPESELLDIFKHEDIHVKGLHTIDILISEFTLICSWFNPFVWLLRKGIRENLEFLTDQKVIEHGVDKQTYQYSLLRVNNNSNTAVLGNQFSFKTLKRRIMMMNKKRSTKIQIGKYAFMLPVFVLTAGAFTLNKAEAKITQAVDAAKEIKLESTGSTIQFLADTVEKELNLYQDSLKGKIIGLNLNDGTVSINKNLSDTTVKALDGAKRKDGARISVKTIPQDVLYVMDGKPIDVTGVSNLDPDDIKAMDVLKGESGTAKYGEKGKNGVIEITSKSGDNRFSKTTVPAQIEYKPTTAPAQTDYKRTSSGFLTADGKKVGLIILDGQEVTMAEVDKVPENKLKFKYVYNAEQATKLYGDKGKNGVITLESKNKDLKPLIFLDGELLEANFKTINPDEIQHIEVVKDAAARASYGEKAIDGVILVTTKKWALENPGASKIDIDKKIKEQISKEKTHSGSVKTIKGSVIN